MKSKGNKQNMNLSTVAADQLKQTPKKTKRVIVKKLIKPTVIALER